MNRTTLMGLAAALVLLLVAAVWIPLLQRSTVPEPDAATVFDEARRLPDAELVDQHGERFSTAALEDRFSLMFFGFTHCPDICPITLHVLAEAHAAIEAREPDARPELVFVSVDPARDTPERMREYLGFFDARFTGVTAGDEAIAPLLEALGVMVHRQEHQGEHYNVVHNGTVYVIGPQRELVAVFSSGQDAATITEDYLRIRTRYLRNPPPVSAPL
jgi:protein SCO1